MEEEITFGDSDAEKRVLLIDDDFGFVQAFTEVLKENFSLIDIKNEKSIKRAESALRAGDFDLIFLDLNIEDSIGPATVKEMRRITPDIPLIVVTKFGSSLVQEEVKACGGNFFLLKSEVTVEKLFSIFQSCGLDVQKIENPGIKII